MRLLARIIDLYVATQSGPFFRNMNPATRNEAEVEAGKKSLAKALADLEHFTSSGPYAVGAKMTLADVAMLPSLLMTSSIVAGFGVTNLFEGLPKLSAWWQTMQSDPLTGPFCKEYLAAMQAFLASRALNPRAAGGDAGRDIHRRSMYPFVVLRTGSAMNPRTP